MAAEIDTSRQANRNTNPEDAMEVRLPRAHRKIQRSDPRGSPQRDRSLGGCKAGRFETQHVFGGAYRGELKQALRVRSGVEIGSVLAARYNFGVGDGRT
jgi:hypothetical protein